MFNNSFSIKISKASFLVVWRIFHIIESNLYELTFKLHGFMQKISCLHLTRFTKEQMYIRDFATTKYIRMANLRHIS